MFIKFTIFSLGTDKSFEQKIVNYFKTFLLFYDYNTNNDTDSVVLQDDRCSQETSQNKGDEIINFTLSIGLL